MYSHQRTMGERLGLAVGGDLPDLNWRFGLYGRETTCIPTQPIGTPEGQCGGLCV